VAVAVGPGVVGVGVDVVVSRLLSVFVGGGGVSLSMGAVSVVGDGRAAVEDGDEVTAGYVSAG